MKSVGDTIQVKTTCKSNLLQRFLILMMSEKFPDISWNLHLSEWPWWQRSRSVFAGEHEVKKACFEELLHFFLSKVLWPDLVINISWQQVKVRIINVWLSAQFRFLIQSVVVVRDSTVFMYQVRVYLCSSPKQCMAFMLYKLRIYTAVGNVGYPVRH